MPRSVLVVDDSSTVQDAVRFALAGEDWTVHCATDSEAAREAVRSTPPDAVLCDVSLGEEDGYEVCRSLRSLPERSAIPVIMMGGRVSEGLATAVGAAGVLAKPFGSAELLDALEASLEAGTLGLELEEVALPPEEAAAEPAAGDAVEVIDLSDQDEFEEFELLEDLEPVDAGTSVESPAETAGDSFAASRSAGFELEATSYAGAEAGGGEPSAYGDVELPSVDLGSEETEQEPSPLAGEEEPATEESAGLEAGGLWGEGAAAQRAEPEGDLLGDIDLGGFAAQEPPPSATVSVGESRAGAEEESLPTGDEGTGETEEAESPDYGGALDAEPPAATGEPEEAERAPPAATGEETEDEFYAWASGEPAAGATEEERSSGERPELRTEAVTEPSVAETEPLAETSEIEPSEAAEEEHAEPLAAAEAAETDPTWAHPEPTPPTGVPWDLARVEPEPRADAMATRVEDAVREALQENLSPEKLAPVVEAAVERAVWQVVPELAERLIRETIEKLRQEPPPE